MKKFLFVTAFSLFFSFQTSAQSLDISGYKIVQANASLTITLPAGTTIEPGGYLIVARNATKASFESFWATTLAANVGFINGTDVIKGNGFPTINGDEIYTLQNAASAVLDGPTVAMLANPAAQSLRRVNASAAANLEASWIRAAATTGNPGTGMTNTATGKLIISEFSDASTFANEFVELYYDATPSAKGAGIGLLTPTRWKFSTPTDLQLVIKSATDTIRGMKIEKIPVLKSSNTAITVVPNTVSLTFSGDTISLSNFALGAADSLILTMSGVTAADTTDEFVFKISSSKDGVTYLPIQTNPKMLVYGSPRPLSVVKRKESNGLHSLLGKWTVVRGVITVANEFGGPSYLQDATTGMALFDSSVSNNVQRGDGVVLLGLVAPYNELFELTPCTILEKISEGNNFDTLTVSIPQIKLQTAAEPYESRMVRINNITSVITTTGAPASAWNTTGSGSNYKLIAGNDTLEIRISSRTNLANLPIPNGKFDVVGALGQFLTSYQILPRSYQDIIVEGAGPRITSVVPYESNITPTNVTFNWTTDVAGTSTVNYGKTTYTGTVSDTNKVTNHSVTVSGLQSATLYNVRIGSANDAGATYTANYIVSTSSQNSSGQVNVYFSKSVKTTLSRGENAQTADLSSKVISRMNAATYSIDVALYSLSGTVGANIANALIAAKSRGVKVRVIGEKDNQSTAPWSTLKNGGITVIDDGFDATNAGAGLMHNKFIVIDNQDTTSETDDWVFVGSWNATDPGTNNDAQNIADSRQGVGKCVHS